VRFIKKKEESEDARRRKNQRMPAKTSDMIMVEITFLMFHQQGISHKGQRRI